MDLTKGTLITENDTEFTVETDMDAEAIIEARRAIEANEKETRYWARINRRLVKEMEREKRK